MQGSLFLSFLAFEQVPHPTCTQFNIHISKTTQQTDSPEPLIAIWEPHALATILNYSKTSANMYPTKFLLNHPIHKVYPKQDVKLINANHTEDFDNIKKLLKTYTI